MLAWAAKERVLFSSGTEDSTISAWAILPSNELELLMKLDAHKDTVQVRGPWGDRGGLVGGGSEGCIGHKDEAEVSEGKEGAGRKRGV